jgi:hypothetical protein
MRYTRSGCSPDRKSGGRSRGRRSSGKRRRDGGRRDAKQDEPKLTGEGAKKQYGQLQEAEDIAERLSHSGKRVSRRKM